MTWSIGLGLALLALGILGGVTEARRERKVVRTGCPCGAGPMTVFDHDSQGGTLVKCEKCGNHDAISWVAVPESWPRRWSGCV